MRAATSTVADARPAVPRKPRGSRQRRWLEALFILPLVLYMAGFTVLPILNTLWLSLYDSQKHRFPALVNYRGIITDGQFWPALWNTLVLTALGLVLELAAGLAVALVLREKLRFKGLIRTLLLVPMGVPTLVAGVIMLYIFSTQGYLNDVLYKLHLVQVPVNWAGGSLALVMIVLADMWKVTPMVALILLAGLEAIPGQTYEAAAIDGASPWQCFRHVTWPLLRPALATAVILRAIDAFRIFEIPLVLTGRQTPVLATLAYTEYETYNNPYASAAASALIVAIIVIFLMLYLRLQASQEVHR